MISEFDLLVIFAIFGANAALVYFAKNKFQSQIEKSMNIRENKKLAITEMVKSEERF